MGNDHVSSLLQLPVEIQAEVLKYLNPWDVRNLLQAFEEQLSSLFHIIHTNPNHSDHRPFFNFPNVKTTELTSFYSHSRDHGLMNCIEITNWNELDLDRFTDTFSQHHNVILISLHNMNPVSFEHNNVSRLLSKMLPRSYIILEGLHMDYPLSTSHIGKLTHKLIVGSSHSVTLYLEHDGKTQPLAFHDVCNMEIGWICDDSLQALDFSQFPTRSLKLDSEKATYSLIARNIAAEAVIFLDLTGMTGVNLNAKSMVLRFAANGTDEVRPTIRNIIAPNLDHLVLTSGYLFPTFTDVILPSLTKAEFHRPFYKRDGRGTVDGSLDSDFSFLSNVIELSLYATLGPLINRGSFDKLEKLNLHAIETIPDISFPKLEVLNWTMFTVRPNQLPFLRAPLLKELTLRITNETLIGDQSIAQLPEILFHYPKLTNFGIFLYIDVGPQLSKGIENYIRTMGNQLETISLYGSSLDLFSDPTLKLNNVTTVSIGGDAPSTKEISISFEAQKLTSLTVELEGLQRLTVSGKFPSIVNLASYGFGSHEIELLDVETLEHIDCGMRHLSKLTAKRLPVLKTLTYSEPEDGLLPLVEEVEFMNPNVVRTMTTPFDEFDDMVDSD